ncbi:MAG: flagellar biosynthetic protein FliO [Clostridiales Family XIII bacterium]|nr:flagellar biosynthetic protein FliO [Clostridiales Family XIII bacterium]
MSIALTLVGIIAVLALTYFASKWYAGRMGPMVMGKHIKVVDRLVVGKAASILIIELAGDQYLVGVTEQGFSILKELDEPIVPGETGRGLASNLRRIDFRDILLGRGNRKGGDPQ